MLECTIQIHIPTIKAAYMYLTILARPLLPPADDLRVSDIGEPGLSDTTGAGSDVEPSRLGGRVPDGSI
jgi:hypothetical protein